MQNHELRRWISGVRTTLLAGAALTGALALSPSAHADALVRLSGHVPAVAAKSALLGHVTRTEPIPLAIMLPSRNQAELKDLIRRQSDPKDALYGNISRRPSSPTASARRKATMTRSSPSPRAKD